MSTRKSSVTVTGGKFESADSSKDKDNEPSSNVIDEDGKFNTTGETDAASRASTPIQKDNPRAASGGGGNSSSRITRNSPLLISPNTKKEQLAGDSEPTNSEGEDGGPAKKQIRGRKSIKEAKETATKEQSKETVNKPPDEPSKENIDIDKEQKFEESAEKFEKCIQNREEESKECKDQSAQDEKNEEDAQVKDCKETDTIKNEQTMKDTGEGDDRDLKDLKESKDKDLKENKDKDTKDSKETKDKDFKEAKDPKELPVVTNRLTRNAAAQEVASKSRITRNRQSSVGSATRPETPPTARRGRVANSAKKPAEIAGYQKRKRSVEESSESPISKVVKTEPKDVSETPEEDESSGVIPISKNADLEGIRIKQELIESDDAVNAITEVASSVLNASTTTSTVGRGRGRWTGRKPTQTVSPSTRSTRQNKVASPVTSDVPDRKRRRTIGTSNRRGSTLLKNAGAHTSGTNTTPDEDSKDSMASSMDDILLTDIKLEKLTPDLEDNQDVEMEIKKSLEEDIDEPMEISSKTESDVVPVEPLTVKTDANIRIDAKEEETERVLSVEASTSASDSNCLNKDASLSPELVSEGVSEISVKQFYNKPKFLENNLGIEEDPKLGEIVQKVTTVIDTDCTNKETMSLSVDNETTANGDSESMEDLVEAESFDEVAIESNNPHEESFSIESLKEGDLTYEDSNDGKKTPLEETENARSSADVVPLTDKGENELIENATSSLSLEQSLDAAVAESKLDEDSLGENLVIAEEDLDDDDITVEESETISMDNNPSLHDDAPEEEQDVVGENQVEELLEDVNNDVVVPDDELANENTNEETKQTNNECDIEKAKLQDGDEKTIINEEEEEIKANENELLKIENASVVCKTVAEEEEIEENNTKNSQKDKEKATKAKSAHIKTYLKSDNSENEQNTPKLTTFEIKNKESFKKSIIVTKFDSDAKEPSNPIEKVAGEEKTTEKTMDIKTSAEERRLSTTNSTELMEVDNIVKPERLETGEAVKDEVQSLLKHQSTIEKMDISDSETLKYEKSSSNSNSPVKSSKRYQRDSKDDDANSIKSTLSTDANSWTTIEPDCDDEEKLRLKEQHLKNLGLLTHKAAEKRRQEFIQTAAAIEATRAAAATHHNSKRNGSKSSSLQNSSNSGATSHEYTGTLKTVIKLNRNSSGTAVANTTTMTVTTASTSNGSNSGRKSNITNSKDNNSGVRRQSLKMTFQKGRGRGHTAHGSDRTGSSYAGANSADNNEHGEDLYYTIQNENEGGQKNCSGSSMSTATAGTKDQQTQKQQIINNYSSNIQTHGRKPYNSRSNTSNSYHHYQNHHFTANSSNIESSHSEGNHDGATNATGHTLVGIISHKKDDREEILIPEKASSFKFHPGRLCEDQCYYCSGKFGLYDTPCHVGQIKSVERQQKILKNEEKLTVDNCLCDACFRHVDRRANVPSYKKRLSTSGNLENVNSTGEGHTEDGGASTNAEEAEETHKCVVPDCGQPAPHSLRRKCIRKSVKKFLLNFDMPTGSQYIWLCQSHYNAVIQCSGCVLCKRRLVKNHMYHITSDTERLEKALTDMGIPVQLGIGTAVCKLCRYFANLLMKPPGSTKFQKAEFVKNYRKRLLQFHNIHDGSNDASEVDDDESHPNSSVTNDGEAIKDLQTISTRRINKDQGNINSPTASSSSSVICMTENAVDHTDDVASLAKIGEKSPKKSNLLENDVSMDYDMSAQNSSGEISHENSKSPISSPNAAESDKQSSRLKAILQSDGKNNSTAKSDLPCVLLRANPNLSMRELFPGEEDLGLNFKAPFGSSNSQRTPEGWTRVQTFLQYDEPTRRLWEELEKPYGNQSSFLRHLILLEKYYRNGDLVLSANASPNARSYTQRVRQRLNSYDQGHCSGLDEDISSKSPAPTTKEKTKTSDIPLVEINDDDEDETENGVQRKDDSNAHATKVGHDDDDVIIDETPSSDEKNPAKRRTRSVSVDKLTRQLSTNAVTIIARPKDTSQKSSTSITKSANVDVVPKRTDPSKTQSATSANTYNLNINNPLAPLTNAAMVATTSTAPASIASNSSNSRSILKSNLLGIANNKSVEILPIASQKTGSNANTISATTVNIPAVSLESSNNNSSGNSSCTTKQQKILEVANKLRESQMEAAAAAAAAAAKQQNTSLTSPPELVSLQRRSASHASSSGTTTSSSSSMSSTTASLINAKRPHLMSNRPATHNRSSGLAPNVVILPNTLSSHERAESKSWRPTLMSVEDNQHMLNKNGPLYQTADGRRLPGLVQVQSGGKPFLISIFDYNRMCILRREKLMRDKSQQQQRHTQQSSNYNKMNNSGNNSNSGGNSSNSKHSHTNAPQQQYMQMLQFQKQQQQAAAAMKAATNANNRYQPIAPKPSSLNPNSAPSNVMQGSNAPGSNVNINNASNSNRLAVNQPNFPMPLLANALSNANAAAAAATLNNNPWLWSNFPDAHELLRNGAHGGLNKLPPLLPKPATAPSSSVANNLAPPATITSKQLQQHQQQQHQQMLLDNTLMSKIPKSLTVIPQHKLMGSSSNAATKE